MKIILSRKGFDSSSGGCPSPILPNGRLITLPIPDASSGIRYRDIHDSEVSMGKLVADLTKGRIKSTAGAHLDPDLVSSQFDRSVGWQPVLGQTGSAQGHLARQGVEAGDLFIFFGLFRPVEMQNRKWRFVPSEPARHIIWGWMQIGEILKVDSLSSDESEWLSYHPHCHGEQDPANTLYIASQQLSMKAIDAPLNGSGVFEQLDKPLILSQTGQRLPSQWQLPAWIYPGGRKPLSYHDNLSRWQLNGDACLLRSVARGQEFVLDTEVYPESIHWAVDLIASAGKA